MSVNGISPTSTTSYDSPFADRRQKLEALRDALDSGDLQSAQAAFAALNPSLTAGAASVSGAKTQAGSDLQAIGQALNAGDLDAAQKAFAAMRQHRHHGGHHHSAPPTDPTSTAADGTTGDNVGTSLNVIA